MFTSNPYEYSKKPNLVPVKVDLTELNSQTEFKLTEGQIGILWYQANHPDEHLTVTTEEVKNEAGKTVAYKIVRKFVADEK